MEVRTRIAPSPTGFVHIGTIYNALFAHAWAKHNNGKFILRIEDTDQKRYVEGANEQLFEMLNVFGLTPDEGPQNGGPYTPYIQSERMKTGIYMEKAKELINKGYAYYCFLTPKELEELRNNKSTAAFRSPYRNYPQKEAERRIGEGEKYVIRLKVPDNEIITVNDAILGEVKWNSNEVDDQVLMKSDGFPTYHLAVVIDDNDMKITHITRGYEWLPSTPKHILLYKYFGYKLPVFAHSGLILDPSGGKLSKRKGNVSAKQFLIDGYIVPATLNFLMLMGWSSPIERKHGEKEQEFFTHDEFIKLYELNDRRKTNAIFDVNKLLWFNHQYIMKMDIDELTDLFLSWINGYGKEKIYENFDFENVKKEIENKGKEYLKQCLLLEQSRVTTLAEIPTSLDLFYVSPIATDFTVVKQLKKVTKDQSDQVLKEFFNKCESLGNDSKLWKHEEWENIVRGIAASIGIKDGQAFMCLRFAVTGKAVSPPLFEIMQILGIEEVKKRLNRF